MAVLVREFVATCAVFMNTSHNALKRRPQASIYNSVTKPPLQTTSRVICFARTCTVLLKNGIGSIVIGETFKQRCPILSAPTKALSYILCILLLICFYMFRRNCPLQGSYTNVVKTYSNKIFLQ
jgi:hypothetical protein